MAEAAGEALALLMNERVAPELRSQAAQAAQDAGRPAVVHTYADGQARAALLPEAEVLYGGIRAGEAARAPHLRWVHVGSAGVDGLPLSELAAAGIMLTCARGQHADTMADHAMALLLALSRGIPAYVHHQDERRWRSVPPVVLRGRRLGILGYGRIGRAIAVRAAAFGMEIWATRRHPAPDPLVARMFGPSREELGEVLARCDDLVAVLPSTVETRGLLDAAAFTRMRPGARLVNLGRGDLIIEGALDDALRSGQLAGAGCDCLPREPLPPESPLWGAPNMIITPHTGGAQPRQERLAMDRFAANVGRYCRGEPLDGVVDLEAGY